jgi:hypothetical protein
MGVIGHDRAASADADIEADFERRVSELARQLDQAGFLVTVRGEIEAAAVERLTGITVRSLRRMRDAGTGPQSSRTLCRVALYRLADVVFWINADGPS